MKNKIIFILLTLWLVGSFVFELFEFIISLRTLQITVPLASSIGLVSYVGLVLRKQWGLTAFYMYLFLLVFYSAGDIFYKRHVGYSIIVLAVITVFGFPLGRYLTKKRGLLWKS